MKKIGYFITLVHLVKYVSIIVKLNLIPLTYSLNQHAAEDAEILTQENFWTIVRVDLPKL